jgi:ubiquitin C-terminal hydrolase
MLLLQAYLASEVLGPSDTWHCPKCRTDVRAKKALDLWCLPEVLIIHLKRFSYSGSGYYSTMSSKIDNLVTFPLQVRLRYLWPASAASACMRAGLHRCKLGSMPRAPCMSTLPRCRAWT